MKKLKDLSKSDRPREKLKTKGPEALSDLERMAILLGSGTKESDVLTVAGRILKVLDSRNEKLSVEELQKIEGVGPAKASLIAAALEFARRRIRRRGCAYPFRQDPNDEPASELLMRIQAEREKMATEGSKAGRKKSKCRETRAGRTV